MKMSLSLALLLVLVGCGAAATLPLEESLERNQTFSQAIWASNQGDHSPWVFSTRDRSIIVNPSSPAASYVHGAYLVDVPDVEKVSFQANVGILEETADPVLFQLYAQKGLEFALLGEVSLNYSQSMQVFRVDLSEFKGQSVILILGLSATGQNSLSSATIWSEPQIAHP